MLEDGLALEMERIFPASRGRVFEFFADAASLAKWLGPSGFSIPSIDFAPRVGGAYRIRMQPPDSEAFSLSGTFLEVDAPSHLVFTFVWEPADSDDQETVAELTFREIDDSTAVHLGQGPFETESAMRAPPAGLDRVTRQARRAHIAAAIATGPRPPNAPRPSRAKRYSGGVTLADACRR